MGSAECGISGIAAGTELGPRLGFDDSFVGTTRADGEAVEGSWFFVAGWRSVSESRVGDLVIIFSNSIKKAGRPLNGGDLEVLKNEERRMQSAECSRFELELRIEECRAMSCASAS